MDDELSVGSGVDIEFDGVCTKVGGALERLECILRTFPGCASVGNDFWKGHGWVGWTGESLTGADGTLTAAGRCRLTG
jgi:hypothetical protein